MFSVARQLAAESEWLQENEDRTFSIARQSAADDASFQRVDWRGRATSRARKVEREVDGKPPRFKRRIRFPVEAPDIGKPFFDASQSYAKKFLRLLALEEAEDEAALQHRLSTWSVDRLRLEGYAITGLYAYWLQENQFGRPVASFNLGPGVLLPENKFENGTQVLLSRVDPLKETPLTGSVLSRTQSQIRICFPSLTSLDDGEWRLDLGRANLMYERMRTAISCFANNPRDIEKTPIESSSQYISQGTGLRDVLLRSFAPSPQEDQPKTENKLEIERTGLNAGIGESEPWWTAAELQRATNEIEAPTENSVAAINYTDGLGLDKTVEDEAFANSGAFKYDQRILSWAKRYSRTDPIVIEGDPPLDHLNTSQKRAMALMIGERISLVQGPPGTGKTKTIIETINLLKVHFEVPHPILVCTYTNVAVDNLVEGFASAGVKPLRIGSNGHVRQTVLHYSLDYMLTQHRLHSVLTSLVAEEKDLAARLREAAKESLEQDTKLSNSSKPRQVTISKARALKDKVVRMDMRHKSLKKQIYAIQQQMLRETIANADVICTTCITAACNALNVIDFPVVFIDEASMSTEPASLIPIMKGSEHIALIGDHKQLPPVIISQQAKEDGYGVSLFERLTEEKHVPSIMLDVQYRMHPAISQFPAREFYNLALQDGTVDALGQALPGLHPPNSKHLRLHKEKGHRPSVIFLDHTGNESFKGKSRVNITEAHIVVSVVEDLLLNNPDLRGKDIGIIAPYAAQITLLHRLINLDKEYQKRFKDVLGDLRTLHLEQVEIKTVDGFEGREKEVIIFSTVRNNAKGHIGFLADKKRLNVGLTRAKRGLFVVGSISTLKMGSRIGSTPAAGMSVDENGEGRIATIAPEGPVSTASPGTTQRGSIASSMTVVISNSDVVLELDPSHPQPPAKKRSRSTGGKGAESWRRYADYLQEGGLVITLTGAILEKALYEHLDRARGGGEFFLRRR